MGSINAQLVFIDGFKILKRIQLPARRNLIEIEQ
jgi:hypothetical protein